MLKNLCRLVAVALIAAPAMAQSTRSSERAPIRHSSASLSELQDAILTGTPEQRQQAIGAIRSRMALRGLTELRASFIKPMMNAKLYKEVAELAREGILQHPADTRSVEAVLTQRVKALLALGQPQQALAEAKGLFNVSSMLGTSDAILTVAECLNAAHPDDKDVFNRFRSEQIAGATFAPATQPGNPATASASAPKCSILAAIKIDPAPYADAIKSIRGEDAASLMARGNLLLLCDRVKEAREVFERLYTLSSAELSDSSEALARCIKAEDGTVGRANAFVLSIRPKRPSSSDR